MCRLLTLYNADGADPNPALHAFRLISENSREYQGHGWGCAWLTHEGKWKFHHNIDPIWQDPRDDFPRTKLFLAHARSAFRDEGIAIENNMPFSDGENVFIFNGELRGVRIKAEGRIGAEKIFNTIKRLDKGDLDKSIPRATAIIEKRSRYIRAMNFVIANRNAIHYCCLFNEDPDYFQMQRTNDAGTMILCSDRLALEPSRISDNWQPVDKHSIVTEYIS